MSAARDAGYAAMQSGDVSGAIAQLEQATAADPNDFQTCLYLGAAYGQAERHMDAVTVLTKAVQLQPANPQARYNLAVAMESAGYREQALTAAQQAVQLQPDYSKAQEMVARLSGAPTTALTYGQPPALLYGQPQKPTPYGQLAQPALYGQSPPAPYGQPQQPPYGQPQQPYGQPYGAMPPGALYQPQGAASYGGSPIGQQVPFQGGAPMFQMEAPAATPALIISILGLCLCWCFAPMGLFAPIGLGFALKARKQIAQNPNLAGAGKATAALVLSILGCVMLALAVLFVAFSFVMRPSGAP